MYKKIILIICLLFLNGCTMYYMNDKSYEDIINITINANNNLDNTNNIGYKFYLPINFNIFKDDEYNQTLSSFGNNYYLYVDIVSYYYKNDLTTSHDIDDYKYYTFNSNGKSGYLKITKDNDYFFVELCYNYAIIEVGVEENNLRYAIAQSISILNSIKYNDLVIEKYIGENDIESSETIYKIPTPAKESKKNVLESIDESEKTVNNEE